VWNLIKDLQQIKDDVRRPADDENKYDGQCHLDRFDLCPRNDAP